jgi:hypothetical protein
MDLGGFEEPGTEDVDKVGWLSDNLKKSNNK